MRYLLILVLLITCSTSARAETGRGWSPWYKLDDGGLNGIEFSHKNDCQPGGTAVCNLQWRFSSGYETPVEIEYTIAWERAGPQKLSKRVQIQPGINVSDAFTVKGAALDEVTVRLISDKKILAEARKEVRAELKRQEDERKRKEEAARKAELARKAEQARQEKLAQAAALPYAPGEAVEVTQFREETARRIEEDRQQEENRRQEERVAEDRRQEREREQRAEEERQAQISRDEEDKKAEKRRDEEREAREWREKREAQEAEDRQSTRDYNASIGAQIMQNINNNAAVLANIDRQTSAAINESNRVRAAQAAERERARAEKEEREADRRRAAERDRTARADAQRTADARRVQEEARNRQQEQERRQKQARLEEQAQLEKQARQQEQERKQEQARKKAEAERAKLAEQQAEKQARAQYLKSITSGTRLVATKCPDGEGKYYATGTRPKIKPEVVSCVDVRFRAYCAGDSLHFTEGTAHNFVGMAGCFGDTYDISPKPGCKVDQVRIEVVEARECSK